MARAVVTLTIEMDAPGSWGADCTLGQIERQAKESAVGALTRVCERSALNIKVIGKPKVATIIVPTE